MRTTLAQHRRQMLRSLQGRCAVDVASQRPLSEAASILLGRPMSGNGSSLDLTRFPSPAFPLQSSNMRISGESHRWFSSTPSLRSPPVSKKQSLEMEDKDDENVDPTWREQIKQRRELLREEFSERSEKGRAAAKRGAKSASSMLRQYGPVFVTTYGTVYVSTLALFFAGIESGAMDPATIISYISPSVEGEDPKSTVEVVVEVMNHYAWTRPAVPFFESKPWLANFGVAWIAVKFTEPIRFGLTVAIVPRLARHFGYVTKNEDETVGTSEDEKATTKSSS